MKSSHIRKLFFDFFSSRGHEIVTSSSLIPAQDPTLLFANAGMNQFKDLFLGLERRSYNKAVSIQKCVRAGGKHNDLDNVGFTKRHLTFFEMMGNFSFGDYFKKEAITYAWDFLTKELGMNPDMLHATVFETDQESYDFWHNVINIPVERIHRLGKKDNFWSMGDVGPCGPCTEIHLDRGAANDVDCPNPTICSPACDCDRFLEIWNVVFMQYDQLPDGSLKELARKGVDTGMGLERLSAALQGVDSVFNTDLFLPLIAFIEKETGVIYVDQTGEKRAAFHVLADHARCATMLIADGCAPSNDGRGYVLRKIIRRAALFGQKVSASTLLFPRLSGAVVEEMGIFYPSILEQRELIYSVLKNEIEKFTHNLIRGTAILNAYISNCNDQKIVDGKQAFMMYDTYGFPLELVDLIAQDHGFSVDHEGFAAMMVQQQSQSGKKVVDRLDNLELSDAIKTVFTGYDELVTQGTVIALVHNEIVTDSVPAGQSCYIITDRSPFFIVGGGQVPDAGVIVIGDHRVPVEQARYINGRIALKVTTPVAIIVGQTLMLNVDKEWRTNAMNNHTGTHLLQAALIQVLGKQVKQAGSLVHPDYLRFDFTYHQPITNDQISEVENIVNEKIRANIPVSIHYVTMKEALGMGALAFFGDKYNPEKVRLVGVDDFSRELCGGTHVPYTGVIGVFKIIEVTTLAAGQKRIIALTGNAAVSLFQQVFNDNKTMSKELKVPYNEVVSEVVNIKEDQKQLRIQVKKLKHEIMVNTVPSILDKSRMVHGIHIVSIYLDHYSFDDIKDCLGLMQEKQEGCYVIVSAQEQQKTVFGLSLSSRFVHQISLIDCVAWLRDTFGVKSGGTKTYVQGAGFVDGKILVDAFDKWIHDHCRS